jgi:hypothetical protein
MWHLKEHLLKLWQILICVNGPLKKHVNENIPPDFQSRGLENEQFVVV